MPHKKKYNAGCNKNKKKKATQQSSDQIQMATQQSSDQIQMATVQPPTMIKLATIRIPLAPSLTVTLTPELASSTMLHDVNMDKFLDAKRFWKSTIPFRGTKYPEFKINSLYVRPNLDFSSELIKGAYIIYYILTELFISGFDVPYPDYQKKFRLGLVGRKDIEVSFAIELPHYKNTLCSFMVMKDGEEFEPSYTRDIESFSDLYNTLAFLGKKFSSES